MVKNKIKWQRFEREIIRKENIPYKKALFLYEALHSEAVLLGGINSRSILDGLDKNIRLAGILNSLGQ